MVLWREKEGGESGSSRTSLNTACRACRARRSLFLPPPLCLSAGSGTFFCRAQQIPVLAKCWSRLPTFLCGLLCSVSCFVAPWSPLPSQYAPWNSDCSFHRFGFFVVQCFPPAVALLFYSFTHHSLCPPPFKLHSCLTYTFSFASVSQKLGYFPCDFYLNKVNGFTCQVILCLLSIYFVSLCVTFHVTVGSQSHLHCIFLNLYLSTCHSSHCRHQVCVCTLGVWPCSSLLSLLPIQDLCLTCPVWQLALLSATS